MNNQPMDDDQTQTGGADRSGSQRGGEAPTAITPRRGYGEEMLKELFRSLGVAEDDHLTRNNIINGINENQNLTFILNLREMARILKSIEEAEKVIDEWLSGIERNEIYYSHEKINDYYFRKLQAALNWIPTLKYYPDEVLRQNPDLAERIKEAEERIVEEAHARMGVHDIKRAIASNDFKNLDHYTSEVGMHGLLLGFKSKQANIAFNLYQRFFERYLYNYGKARNKKTQTETEGIYQVRMCGELISGYIRPAIREELKTNWMLYGFNSLEEAMEAERIGYSVFTASQRKAVHVSRGHINNEFEISAVPGVTARPIILTPDFLSDPDEIVSNLYAPLEFQLLKWSRPSEAHWEVLNNIMTFMGNGNLQIGEQIYNDSLNIVDLWSSGWRIKLILETIGKRIRKSVNYDQLSPEEKQKVDYRIESLVLGMRFKDDSNNPKWLRAIARYRPLELLKEFIIDIDRHGREREKTARQKQIKEMFEKGEFNVGGKVFRNYIELEEVLGRYAYPIYEAGLKGLRNGEIAKERDWRVMRAVDIGNASSQGNTDNPFAREDYEIISLVVNKINSRLPDNDPKKLTVDEFIELYRKVQQAMSDEETIKDITSEETKPAHSYFFTRTMFVDDVPFDLLEREEFDDIPLSDKYAEARAGGRDSYKRIWGDTSNAFQANEAFMKAIFSTDVENLLKSLVEGANFVNAYAGKKAALQTVYGIAGGWLDLARADALWGALGLQNKLPFATSELERLFGQGAPSLSREELFQAAEKLKLIFGDLTKEFPEIGEIEERMSRRLGTDKKMMWLARSKAILLLLILAFVQQSLKNLEEDTKE